MNKVIGLILCAIGGAIVGTNAKNIWAILGTVLAQFGIALIMLH